jgi:hypothetical protein
VLMATVHPKPVELHAHAMDNLRYIRGAMERAGLFTTVPGLGGVLMGSTALAAAWIAGPANGSPRWLTIWALEAALAMLIGLAAAAEKSRRTRMPLLSGPSRKFLAGFAPALVAGLLLTATFTHSGAWVFLPGTWLLIYGTAVVSGGANSVRVVPLMGACFMGVGTLALLLRPELGNLFLAAGFGGLHIVFGTVIAVKYGG